MIQQKPDAAMNAKALSQDPHRVGEDREKVLEVASLDDVVNILRFFFPELTPQSFSSYFLLLDRFIVVRFQGLYVVKDFKFNVFFLHFGFKDQVNELLELNIF